MKDRLAIIGASYLQKPLLMKARDMGFETHVFAWQEGAVCEPLADCFYPISIIDIESILRICQEIKPQGIVSIGSDLAGITVNRVAAELGLIGNTLDCTKRTTQKFLMREGLRECGMPCPRYWLLEDANPLPELMERDYPLIVKPVDRSGSRGVTLVKEKTDLASAIQAAREESFCKQVILEQFVEGRELSVESISWQGKHYILQFTDKETTGAPHFIEKAHHQPADLTIDQVEELSKIITESLNCLGIEYGASHSELKITSNGEIYIIEIGARMGGDCIGSHLVQLSTGYDYVKGVIEVAVGQFQEPVLSQLAHSGIHYLFTQPGRLNSVALNLNLAIVDHQVLAQIGDSLPEITDSSQRPACYLYQSDKRLAFDPKVVSLITCNE